MKVCYTIFAALLLAFSTQAQQLPLTPVQEIQGWAGQFQPDSCTDGPNPIYLDDTVRVRGVVINNGGLNETSGQTRWIWIRDITAQPSTPFGNITVRSGAATTPTDINTLVSGDTIEVIALVKEFNPTTNGETQLEPISVQLLSFEPGPAPEAFPVKVGWLNGNLNGNGQPNNHLTSGEQYEGNFVEIRNVTVVQVAPSGDRVRILVKDSADNHIWVYDRFRTQRLSNGFVPPNVGDQYTSVRGLIESWKNGCDPGATNSRGYNINPFSLTHYVKGASSPAIGNIRKSIPCPGPAAPVTVSADITDDGTISQAELLYSLDGLVYQTVTATVAGTRYSAQIPGQPNGQIVRYYFRAKDNLNNTTLVPNVPGQIPALFYTSNSEGCTIRDIQYTPYPTGRSGYTGDTLSLQGIVTASAAADNLGFVFIQQENQNEWAGIWVNGGSLISSLAVGDKVSVTGIVEEYFGLTRISNISNASVISAGQPVPQPITVNPATLSTYDFTVNEKYEGMLVKLENPLIGQNLFVVDSNADFSLNRNNGEYRIGADLNDPNTGCRVLAGRQSTTAFSSLNVSYVNSPLWQTQDGTMNVTPVIVVPGLEFSTVQGIMTYSFSNMKLLPRNNSDMVLATSVKSAELNSGLSLYPNPASGSIRLTLGTAGKHQIKVMNSLGQQMIVMQIEGMETELDIRNLPAGIYHLSVSDAQGKITGTRSLSVN
jgi:hypothetical protein